MRVFFFVLVQTGLRRALRIDFLLLRGSFAGNEIEARADSLEGLTRLTPYLLNRRAWNVDVFHEEERDIKSINFYPVPGKKRATPRPPSAMTKPSVSYRGRMLMLKYLRIFIGAGEVSAEVEVFFNRPSYIARVGQNRRSF